MAHEVTWSKIVLETFLEESGINARVELGDEKARILEGIMRTRVAVVDNLIIDTWDCSNKIIKCCWLVKD